MCFGNNRDIFLLADTLQFRGCKHLISRNSYFFSTTRLDFQNTSVKPHLSSTWGDATCTVFKARCEKEEVLPTQDNASKSQTLFVFCFLKHADTNIKG